MRKPIIAGNWKMYKTPAETAAFFDAFRPMVAEVTHCEIVICTPFTNLDAAVRATEGSNIAIGAQNLYWGREGARTGEVSGYMLQAVGCRYVVVGHSERRQFFGETEATVLKRTLAALEYGLTPIVCLGEHLDERESGRTEAVLGDQFEGGLAGLTPEQFAEVVIAYEPVWAIGTGRSATPDMANETHRYIRGKIAAKFGAAQAAATRILYGGSVNSANASTLMAEAEIDGGLVGGASLEPDSFTRLLNY